MANGKRMLRFTAIMIALVGVLGFQMEAMGMLDTAEKATTRPDVIMIDTIAKLEVLEQPAAVFKHDAHTKALKDQGMSCESCHKKDDKGVMALTFNRLEGDTDAMSVSELKEIYHDGCLSCHVSSGDKGFKTGPMVGECRSCHQEKPAIVAEREAAGMDNMLHYTHWASKEIPADAGKDTNCGACHKKQGEEDSWRFEAAKEGMSVEDVFHNQCVTCHQELVVKKAEKTGPVDCASCHGANGISARKAKESKKLREMGGTLPRLPRKQPDAVLMMPKLAEGAPAPKKAEGMAPVAFNHKFHEEAVDTCRACHAEGVNAPMDTSFEAMHDVKNDASCIGCHAREQQRPECASCHDLRSDRTKPSDASCLACHTPTSTDAALLATASKEAKAAEAATLIAARPDTHKRVALDAIPEIVTIDVMAKEYGPSKLPHRKIVLKLIDNMKDDSLAATFHATPEAMCQGCHHNSPASVTPPKCASCHAKPFAEPNMPGLKAAYHGQCMSCHNSMKLEKPVSTNCVACHEKKTK